MRRGLLCVPLATEGGRRGRGERGLSEGANVLSLNRLDPSPALQAFTEDELYAISLIRLVPTDYVAACDTAQNLLRKIGRIAFQKLTGSHVLAF